MINLLDNIKELIQNNIEYDNIENEIIKVDIKMNKEIRKKYCDIKKRI